jgi:hypothetical protein
VNLCSATQPPFQRNVNRFELGPSHTGVVKTPSRHHDGRHLFLPFACQRPWSCHISRQDYAAPLHESVGRVKFGPPCLLLLPYHAGHRLVSWFFVGEPFFHDVSKRGHIISFHSSTGLFGFMTIPKLYRASSLTEDIYSLSIPILAIFSTLVFHTLFSPTLPHGTTIRGHCRSHSNVR